MKKEIRNNLLLVFISIFVSLLFLEIGLRILIDYRHRHFLVRAQDETLYYFSNPNSWEVLQGQSFLKNKPKGTYRIFTFGGSTTEGPNYPNKVSFTKFLEMKLKNMLTSIPIEIVNFGKSGESSQHVLKKLKIALKYEPDLFIVYSGHNEFLRFDQATINSLGWVGNILEKSYLYTKLIKRFFGTFINQTPLYLIEKRNLEDKLICKPEKFMEVQEKYRKNINEIIKLAKKSKVSIILCNVVGNYKGWEPNRSVHKSGLSDEELKKWRYYFYLGKELQEKKEYELAIIEYELAKKIDNIFAELSYQLGKCYEQVGLFQDAKREYLNAVDYDGNPRIVSTLFNKIIEEACKENQIPCVDVVNIFESVSEHSLIGYNIMVDAHHPSILGELLIAKEIVKVMANYGLPVPAHHYSFKNDKSDNWYLAKTNVTQEAEVLHLQNRGLWYAKLSIMRYDPKDRLQRAKNYFKKAYKIAPNDLKTFIGFAIVDLLERKTLQANAHILKACELNPINTLKVLKDPWITNLLLKNNLRVNKNCQIEIH